MMEFVGPVETGNYRKLPGCAFRLRKSFKRATPHRRRVKHDLSPFFPACRYSFSRVDNRCHDSPGSEEQFSSLACPRLSPVVYATTYPHAA